MGMKNIKAFTLVEMVIVISIVIVLSLISVPMYKNYVRDAAFAEGYTLLAQIRDAQMTYRDRYGYFLGGNGYATSYNPVLNINGKLNKYFTAFNVNNSAPNEYSFWAWARIPDKMIATYDYSLLMLNYNLTGGVSYREYVY